MGRVATAVAIAVVFKNPRRLPSKAGEDDVGVDAGFELIGAEAPIEW